MKLHAHDCLIALGSNLADREATLRAAHVQLHESPDIHKLQVSSLYETAPIGGPAGQQSFLNAAARFTTTLPANKLLKLLHSIEAKLGRTRKEHWAARTLDLDLLLYAEEVIQSENLTVPHLRMSFRRFVLVPASEIAGEMMHPTTGHSVGKLLQRLDSQSSDVGVYAVDSEAAARVADMAKQELASDGNRVRVVEDASFADQRPTLLVCLYSASSPELALRACMIARHKGIATIALPESDTQHAITEIVAAIAAISDHPRKLPASDTWPPPLDTR